MPLPKPASDETKEKFMGRCMSNGHMMSEFMDDKQRVAVCMQIWKDKGIPKDAQTVATEEENNDKT